MAAGSLAKAPVFSDARALTKDTLPKAIDILVAGFPCVDVSQAGLKEVWKGQIQHWCFMCCVSHARWPCRWCSWRTSKVGWPVAPCVWWAGPSCPSTLVRPSTCIVTAIDSAATGGSHTLLAEGLIPLRAPPSTTATCLGRRLHATRPKTNGYTTLAAQHAT